MIFDNKTHRTESTRSGGLRRYLETHRMMKTISIAVLVIILAVLTGFLWKRFGTVKFEEDSSFDPITEEDLVAYEVKLGFSLPNDYRNYLLKHNGALPVKIDFWMPNEKDWIESIDEMSGLEPDDSTESLTYYLEGEHGIPEGWIPIAHSGYGDFTVLSVREEDYGKVFYLFHEVHNYNAEERTNGVYLLANTFTEWTKILGSYADEFRD